MKAQSNYTKVQSDRQWIRRVKQEETQLMHNVDEEDEMKERQRLLEMYQKRNGTGPKLIQKRLPEESKLSESKLPSQAPSNRSSKAPSVVSKGFAS